MRPARVLFSTYGSYGDVHPYLALGIALRERGHHVTIATSAAYDAKVRAEGLEFFPVRPDVELENRALLGYVYHRRRGAERVMRYIAGTVRDNYHDLLPAVQAADLIITHVLSFGAVLASRKLGKPWASTVLAPISFLSAEDPPVPAPAPWAVKLRALGPGVMRAFWKLGNWQTMRWIAPILALEAELGLPSRGNPIFEGSHSPALVLALFSKYLAAPQTDWPPHTVVTGFPLFDRHHEQTGLPAELERFLAAGGAPVVFTLGSSAVGAAGDFYRRSLEAVTRLNCRAVFLTGPHPQGLPETLPAGVFAVPYAPHSRIFPRAAAIVHQGGVGTTAQAMASGRPALIVPFGFDQFDNAERVRRLGAAEVLYQGRYTARRAEEHLARLLRTPAYAEAARDLGVKVMLEDGCRVAAEAIEGLLAR